MYKINFYKDRNGKEPIKKYVDGLSSRKDKDGKIKFNKIMDYLRILSIKGTMAGEPYIKHLEGEIWELRPLRDRILFAAWDGQSFILLHQFIKKTQKTPPKEIQKAKRNLEDYRKRRREDHE